MHMLSNVVIFYCPVRYVHEMTIYPKASNITVGKDISHHLTLPHAVLAT